MNSKWLPLTAVAGFAAVLISQAIMPASADRHDDWVRRQRAEARAHRSTSARYHRTTTRNRDWNQRRNNRRDYPVGQRNARFHRNTTPGNTTPEWNHMNPAYNQWHH